MKEFFQFDKKTINTKIIPFTVVIFLGLILNRPYDTLSFIVSSLFWIGVLGELYYLYQGFKNNIWWKGSQKYFIICSFVFFAMHEFLEEKLSPFLIEHQVMGKEFKYWHLTTPTSKNPTWIRLKLNKRDKTYEIWAVRPDNGNWGTSTKGKLSSITKQRYKDNGKIYYAIYLEDFPFYSNRTMLSFSSAFDDEPSLKTDDLLYILDEGDEKNPWH
jgi:hypothetical protein